MDAAERRATVLKTVVEEYVRTAAPVASQTVTESRDLGVSSATVRNDMTQLEREGFLAQPHTSAGRIPTDQGYRYFVDHFTAAGGLPVGQRRAVADFFATTHRALEDLLHETSQLLANLTSHAAVVVGPDADVVRVRTAQLVLIEPGTVLAVVVLGNGTVEREVLRSDLDGDDVARASAAFDAALRDQTLAATNAAHRTGDVDVDALLAQAIGAVATRAKQVSDHLYVGGVSRLAAEQDAFTTTATTARLLEMLEEQVVVVSLVRDLLDHGVNVSIGSENDVDELRDCSIVLAPYQVEGTLAGTVGVLGPTRMDYAQALAAVAAVSQQLGRLLLPPS
ncbi:MAG: heat-inducible transcription repressor HrcA [Acidimicrobiia bacterium]|nr:heat-inducible transcription repressor HrcA [Acidimicrobiia bacterium]